MNETKSNQSNPTHSTRSTTSKKPRKSLADQTLSEILIRRRENLEISLSEAEQATRIRGQYLTAIETADYALLKDDVYARGYVKNYADYLGLDTKPILKLYDSERAGQREMRRQSLRRGAQIKLGLKPIRPTRLIITPRTFVVLSVLALLSVVVGYIIWQVIALSTPPRLTISNQEQRSVTNNYGYVSGQVEGGADLYINDSPVLISGNGTFRERIAVVNGRNEIKITAKNRLGKSVTQSYVITANLPKDQPTISPAISPALGVTPNPSTTALATPPTTTIDGVQASVTVGDVSTWIIVEADGKEIFRGTMLAGSNQVFSAADSLKLATGNAGKTNLKLTNSIVFSKDVGSLGAVGEVKRDIVYKRDTKI